MKMRRVGCWVVAALAFCLSARTQEPTQTVGEVVRPAPRVSGAPKHSDVCFSPRWPRKRPGGKPLEAAKLFHATRLEWVYLGGAAEFCRQAASVGASVCGSVNSNLPDSPTGKATYEVGRARNLDGERVLPGFMHDWGCYWGCANNPEFRRIWLEHAETQVRAGAERIQNDGPRLSEGGMLHWGGCYCEYCVSGFRRFLVETQPAVRLAALGLGPVELFDYAVYLRANRETPPASDVDRDRASELLVLFQGFQRTSVLTFYTDVHAQLEKRVGQKVPFSCNNAEGFLLYLHQVHDFAMFEAYPNKEGIPDFFYRERVLPFRRLGKPFVTTFVSDDVQHTRRYIAQSYAFGQHTIAPWDVFTGAKSPRVFGDPADSADLYGFVRANAALLDGYEEAAVAGTGLEDSRFGEFPPVRLRGGSRQVCAVVRGCPERHGAAVVVHLVEWAHEPEPFTVVLDPRRLFADRPLRVRLLTPAPYDAGVHSQAAETGDMSGLTVEHECAGGRRTDIDVPPLRPWGMVVIEPAAPRRGEDLWAPMIWAETESYYSEQLRVRLDCPSPETTLHFTLDGSEPLRSSARYSSPLALTDGAKVRVRTFAQDGRPGPLSQAEFRRLAGPSSVLRPDAPSLAESLRLWVSADSLADSHGDGDAVSLWPAYAGPAPSASKVRLLKGDVATAPLFRTNRINGHPVVEFSESSHHLDIPRFSSEHLAGKRFTIFMVSRSDDLQFGFGANARSGSGGIPRLYVTRGALHYDVLRGIPTGAPAGRTAVNTYMHDEGALLTWVDGKPRGRREQAEPVPDFGGGGHMAIPFWGAAEFHGGEMAEIAVFDRPLSESERLGIEAYLAEKYAIQDRPRWR